MSLFLLVNLELNLLFLDPCFVILSLQFNNHLILLQFAPCKVFFKLDQCTLNTIPRYLLFFKASDDLIHLRLVLSPFRLQLLFQLLNTFFCACVSNDLSVIFGFEVFSILPLFIQDVEGNIPRISINVCEMIN